MSGTGIGDHSRAEPLRHPVSRRSLLIAGLGFLLFVVYGSLVPLDFHPDSLDHAWGEFLKIRYLSLGIESRADWVANILIYIPLGFCFTGALAGPLDTSLLRRLMSGIAVFVMGTVVAVGIEFAQLFFPPRSVLLNDIVAEISGTALGIGLWWAVGAKLAQLVGGMRIGGPLAIRAAVTIYVLGYLALGLFPYDFLVSVAEVRSKFNSELYDPLFAAGVCGGSLRCGVKLAAEVAAAIPIGVLMGMLLPLSCRRPYATAFAAGLVLGVVIETAQFFLASGISQGLSIATRGLALVLGVAAQRHGTLRRLRSLQGYFRPAILLALAPYLALLTAVNGWYAARWTGTDAALSGLAEVHFLPFHYHYFTSETAALQSLLAVTAMYIPVGVGCWAWRVGAQGAGSGGPWGAAAIAAVLAAVVEAGKLFVPEHRPDPTDVLIAGFAAYLVYRFAVAAMEWATEDAAVARARSDALRSQASESPSDSRRAAPEVTARLLSLPLAVMVLGFVWLYPFGAWLGLFLATYCAGLWRWPQAAVPALLALLPVMDFAPWSGWFMIDEFDAVVLATLAVMLWRIPPENWGLRRAGVRRWIALSLGVSYMLSALIGLMPLQPLDLNAFAAYTSHYNSLRSLKGFVWALLLAAPAMHLLRRGATGQASLAAGVLLGLLGVCAAAVWERHLFTGLFDFSTDYRITATFSGMHTGGAFVEGYLVLALPFLAAWAHLRRGPLVVGTVLALFALASYALLVTFARGGYLGYVGAVGILAATALSHARRNRAARERGTAVFLVLAASGLALAVPMLDGSYMHSRWATVEQDAAVRYRHWDDVLAMMDHGPQAILFGMGMGRFPETYFYRHPSGRVPATYRLVNEAGNVYLRLGAGEAVYYGQRVPVEAGRRYLVELDLRGSAVDAELTLGLCEKSILYSFDCKSFSLPAHADGDGWRHHVLDIDAGEIGKGPWYRRRPVEFALSNARSGTLVDVDNVKMVDVGQGRNLIGNGDFSRGHDYWFISADNHLPWHVKNLLLQVFFEQGVLGVLATGLAVIYALARLAAGVVRGELFSGVLLASLGGFLLVGLFDSLFDAPRLAMMFFLLLFAATARPPPARQVIT